MTKPNKNLLEWSVFAVSACIVAAAIGYLAWAAVHDKSGAPQLRVTTGTPVLDGGAYRLPVTVRNTGPETAAVVRVEVVLRSGDKEVERAELDLLFVPRKSKGEGWVTFRNDPRCCTIESRALGFEKP